MDLDGAMVSALDELDPKPVLALTQCGRPTGVGERVEGGRLRHSMPTGETARAVEGRAAGRVQADEPPPTTYPEGNTTDGEMPPPPEPERAGVDPKVAGPRKGGLLKIGEAPSTEKLESGLGYVELMAW